MTDNINLDEIEKSDELTESQANSTPAEEEKDDDRVVVFEEALEAILFAAGHPISYATLARVFGITPSKVKDKVFEYSVKYNDPNIPRGVMLITYPETCQLCTKQYYLTEIRDALGIRKSGSLSTSSMEALAIVAYNQPVTRVFVDTLRRADSSYAMNNLIDRGLIESKGRLDAPGRPMQYGTTNDFLRCFGLADLDSLPKTSDELMEVFTNAKLNEEKSNEQSNSQKSDGEKLENQIEMELDIPHSENESAILENAEAAEAAIGEFELDEPSADDGIVNEI